MTDEQHDRPASNRVEDLLTWALRAQGFDGLYEDESAEEDGCGCFLDDIAPCMSDFSYIASHCRGGYRLTVVSPDGPHDVVVSVKPVTMQELEALGQQTLFARDEVPDVA
jgi:hypothetical protein